MNRFMELLDFRGVPSRILVMTALASYASQAFASLQAWPLWAMVLATLLPWIPVLTTEMIWTYRHYHWFAILYVTLLGQLGHFAEHGMQLYQIFALGLRGHEAHGIFGALDTEWVHFIWNTFLLTGNAILALRFRKNIWLWVNLVAVIWHEIEHGYIMSLYLATGLQGNPGLLSMGGLIAGGLPLTRPVLHFWYNVAETVPLSIAFVLQLRQTYNEWLSKAMPSLSEEMLVKTTNEMKIQRFQPGQPVIRQGETADRMYVIAAGQAVVTRTTEQGEQVELALLGPGQIFGEMGLLTSQPRNATVSARSPLEVLMLERETFREVVHQSRATAEDLLKLAEQRRSELSQSG